MYWPTHDRELEPPEIRQLVSGATTDKPARAPGGGDPLLASFFGWRSTSTGDLRNPQSRPAWVLPARLRQQAWGPCSGEAAASSCRAWSMR
jgi:hypothetical protein